MLDTLMKPSEIVAVYLEENDFTINDLIIGYIMCVLVKS